jgi:hypothetical protein
MTWPVKEQEDAEGAKVRAGSSSGVIATVRVNFDHLLHLYILKRERSHHFDHTI